MKRNQKIRMNPWVCLASVALVAGLTACGDSDTGGMGSSSSETSTAKRVMPTGAATGVLLDSPVAGVTYSASSGKKGVTNVAGEFDFNYGDTVEFKLNDLELEVFYNRPSKRDREVFGALVPYGKVWRTGANEATTFETNKALKIAGDSLPAGKYTLWTIPGNNKWYVIFNKKQYPWGVTETMEPMREAAFDALTVEVPVIKLEQPVEQFTIAFDNSTDNLSLTMAWDTTKIVVPLK